ncbi:condensin-2 complex subunit D3-like [Pollicipes pollicipes]|uniref:condensin-2 complex subunit D3-like n=1 Tax=Pollicipes pollicipes TaxID=41117 RepID=UPI001884ADC0|nr:condensin-2 complex subunit D3-like [Pollicipes pollicipes]
MNSPNRGSMEESEDIDTATLIDLLNNYATEALDPKWVEAVVDADYTECDALPTQFEEQHAQTNWASLLKETGRVCRAAVLLVPVPLECSADGSVLERSAASSALWTALAENGVRHTHLVALLFYFMYTGQKSTASLEDRHYGLLSASIYLNLLAIPGSNAFRVFHPVMYSRALDSFKLLGHLAARSGSPRKTSRAEDELLDEDEADEMALEPAAAARLLRLLHGLLRDLQLLVERFSLRHGADSLEETVQTLVSVTRLETQPAASGRPAAAGLAALPHNAYCCLTALVAAAGVVADPALLTLVQNVCVRVPERAEQRQRGAQSVVRLLWLMPPPLYSQTLQWLCDFAHHEKSGHRLLALEVVSRLLDDGNGRQTHALLVRLIFAQCRDPAASVRSRALNVLTECTVSERPAIQEAVRQLLVGVAPPSPPLPPRPERRSESESSDDTDADGGDILAMLRRRARDDKVMVRKSSLQVLENVMRLNASCVTSENLQVLLEHCRDPALLARKQCQSSLIGLVGQYPDDPRVREAVVRGLLPQIHDPEAKVQERVVQFVEQTILAGIMPYEEHAPTSPEGELPWKLLDLIVKLCFQKYLHKVMQAAFAGQEIKPAVCRALRSHVSTANSVPAWMCLALVSRFSPLEQPLFALDFFTEQIQNELKTEQVLASAPAAARLLAQLTGMVRAAALPLELISAAVDTLATVTLQTGDEEEYPARLEQWCGPLIEDCEDYLSKQLLRPSGGAAPDWEERLVRQVHTLGDLAQLVPARVNKRCFLMLQNLIYVEKGGGRASSAGLQDPSPRLRSVAIATLGKLCLQHEQMAKRVIPALGKILDVTDVTAVKNNVVFTLSDMCVRYATLVDPLMPQVTCCLKDKSLVVRRNTLILLIRLLQEDYLKLKGTFFFRLIQCLLDPEPEMRQLICFYLTERLLKRHPKVFFQHFVECLFLYNEYEEHESYNKLPQTERERQLFSLRGPEQCGSRLLIYKFMLEHMPDDQRFQTSHKLCQDILGDVVDGKIALGEASAPLLRDTLAILSCDEIKLQSLKARPDDHEPATDASGMAEVFQAVAKKTLISQVVKKNVIENMVPIIIALKHKLETARSPLLKELMIYLKDLMKDYKNEIQDILVGDKQLAKEIEFDLRRLDGQERTREGPAAATAAGPSGDAGRLPTDTPRNKRFHSVLVEAMRSHQEVILSAQEEILRYIVQLDGAGDWTVLDSVVVCLRYIVQLDGAGECGGVPHRYR